MTFYRLLAHSQTLATHAVSVAVEVLSNEGLGFEFNIQTEESDLVYPEESSGRADLLWMNTCCEVFIACGNDKGYREFNFSPSGQWAGYTFCSYREGKKAPLCWPDPQMQFKLTKKGFYLSALLSPNVLPPKMGKDTLLIGLSAVIKTGDGDISYWALNHPNNKPDFHHRNSFSIMLDWAK